MPLTPFQSQIARLLAKNRTVDSHLAGGAALHFEPDSIRFSVDLDYFHDSEARVGTAFELDKKLLLDNGFSYKIEMNQPGYIRCLVLNEKSAEVTKVEWAHDSSWRFMPVQKNETVGYVLHPIDLAINKLLALVGRDEARDFLDVQFTHKKILQLGAQCWAACGKDPGFNPLSLLEMLKRRGKYRPEDFLRLNLTYTIDVQEIKQDWLTMLSEAEAFVRSAPFEDVGCLYYSQREKKFIAPKNFSNDKLVSRHFGKPGGVIPVVVL